MKGRWRLQSSRDRNILSSRFLGVMATLSLSRSDNESTASNVGLNSFQNDKFPLPAVENVMQTR